MPSQPHAVVAEQERTSRADKMIPQQVPQRTEPPSARRPSAQERYARHFAWTIPPMVEVSIPEVSVLKQKN
jgi:hypothetical protein